jgi:hypothetical protein
MTGQYAYIRDAREQARVPENGILGQTIHGDEKTKVVRLGSDEHEASEGTFVYIAPYLKHGIKAKTDVVMLLTMIKEGKPR